MGASGDDANGKHYTLRVDKKKKIVGIYTPILLCWNFVKPAPDANFKAFRREKDNW